MRRVLAIPRALRSAAGAFSLTAGVLAVALSAGVLAGCGGSAGVVRGSRSRGFTGGVSNHAGPVAKPGVRGRAERGGAGARVRNAAPQPGWRPHPGPVPILVYHDLGRAPASEPWPGLYMADALFRSEMAWLYSHGYQAVTLDELMRAWYRGGALPAKPIVITFDNGYPPQVTLAPRVMARYGWPGVLNEITEGHLDNAEIRRVLKLGWEVDSHSLTHPDLTELTASALRAQVAGSRQFLRRTFRIPVDSFCYPSSKYDATVIAAVRAAGYTNAVTEGDAYATRADPYLLPRFEMTAGLSQLVDDLALPH